MSRGAALTPPRPPGRSAPIAMKAERIAGLLTPLLGVGGVAVAAFAPLTSHASCEVTLDAGSNCESWSSSLWQDERGAAALVMIVVATLSVGITCVAITDTRGGPRRRGVLVAASGMLTASAVLGLASVGLFILPAALAALIASLAAHRWS